MFLPLPPLRLTTQEAIEPPPKQEDLTKNFWSLLPGPQTQAAETEADELFYGGSAGGGKSALLLILSTTQHKRSIIFRRTYPRLKALIEKSRQILTGVARYNSTDKMWRGIPGDRILEFGAVEREDDKLAWQGVDHDLKAFDEITEFTQSQYTFIIGWNRSAVEGQRSRVICTGNPPTNEQGRWILDYWAPWLKPGYPNPAEPGELRWFITNEKGVQEEVPGPEPVDREGERYLPRSRTFIPASLEDNPYLAKTNYKSVLQGLPEPLRSLLLKGRFDVNLKEDDPWQIIPSAWVKAAMERWKDPSQMLQTSLGVDVARGGRDNTIVAPRYDYIIGQIKVFPGPETPDGLAVAAQVKTVMQNRRVPIHIDLIGVGSSPYDFLKIDRLVVKGLNSGEKAVDKYGEAKTDRTGTMSFLNRRAEWWWNLRELLDPLCPTPIALPPDDDLLSDLTTPRWNPIAIKEVGKIKTIIKVESKEDLKKRLDGRSPDRGDAVAYAFANTDDIKDKAKWVGQV